MKHTLVQDTIRNKDIDTLIEWLKKYPRLTKGPLTIEFEKIWAEWIGTKHAVFVNSGSSANLLTLSALIESNKIKRNSKVVVPALSWATDLAPVMQLELEPVLCDCNFEDLSIDLSHFEEICLNEKPSCLILVSVLGLVPNMKKLLEICRKYNVILVEDTCESFGSLYHQKKLGSFGIASTFSTYFGHHLSTIEGGIICTNDTEFYNILISMRSHGWLRDCTDDFRKFKNEKWKVDNLFNNIVRAFKINGKVVEHKRTTGEKTYEEFLHCVQLPKKTELCFLDNSEHSLMKHRYVYYLQPKPYYIGLSRNEIIQRFINAMKEKCEKNIQEELENYYKTNELVINDNKKTYQDSILDMKISKKLLQCIQKFYKYKIVKIHTRKKRSSIKNKTIKKTS